MAFAAGGALQPPWMVAPHLLFCGKEKTEFSAVLVSAVRIKIRDQSGAEITGLGLKEAKDLLKARQSLSKPVYQRTGERSKRTDRSGATR